MKSVLISVKKHCSLFLHVKLVALLYSITKFKIYYSAVTILGYFYKF